MLLVLNLYYEYNSTLVLDHSLIFLVPQELALVQRKLESLGKYSPCSSFVAKLVLLD